MNRAEKLDVLVGRVEELLAQLPESLSPAIAALRDQVDDGIFDAWTAISSDRIRARRPAVKGAPLQVAAIFGAALLLICSARILAKRQVRRHGAGASRRGALWTWSFLP